MWVYISKRLVRLEILTYSFFLSVSQCWWNLQIEIAGITPLIFVGVGPLLCQVITKCTCKRTRTIVQTKAPVVVVSRATVF